jgi:hypothetical protein
MCSGHEETIGVRRHQTTLQDNLMKSEQDSLSLQNNLDSIERELQPERTQVSYEAID